MGYMYNEIAVVGSEFRCSYLFFNIVVLGEINGHIRRSYCYECIRTFINYNFHNSHLNPFLN